MKTAKRLPTPHADQAGRNTTEIKGKNAFAKIAKLWQPVGAAFEELFATVARFSVSLIDQTTGQAYSADELLALAGRRGPGTPVYAVAATGTYTANTIEDGDELTIAGVTYHFTSSISSTPYYVDMGATDSDALDNLIAAITAGVGEGTAYGEGTLVHPSVTAAAGSGDTVVISAKILGASGNSITTVADASGGSFAATTLVGGIDATAAAAGDQLFDADFLYTAQVDMDVTAITGWSKSTIDPL